MAQLAPGVVIYTCNKAPDRRAENKEEAATKHKLSLSCSQVGCAPHLRRQILQMAQQRVERREREKMTPHFIALPRMRAASAPLGAKLCCNIYCH